MHSAYFNMFLHIIDSCLFAFSLIKTAYIDYRLSTCRHFVNDNRSLISTQPCIALCGRNLSFKAASVVQWFNSVS